MTRRAAGSTMGRFLVVGAGSIGRRHIGNLLSLGVQAITVVEPQPGRRREIEKAYPVRVTGSLEEALGDEYRAALICTPTSMHCGHALAAARKGCHLFVEKPIADSMEGVPELLAEIERRQLTTLVGCNFRFHPGLQRVHSLLREGRIGTPLSARASFGQYLPDWHPREDYRAGYSAQRRLGGGVLLDRIHELDYLSWLLGEVASVSAVVDHVSALEIDTEDLVEMILRFRSGAVASLHVDYLRREYNASLEIIGSQGILSWAFQDSRVAWFTAGEKQWKEESWPGYDPNTMYLEEMRHFLAALDGSEPPELQARDGARMLAIALAARRSAVEERTVHLDQA